MRAVLDGIYRASGALAAVFMVATLAMVLTGIVSRELGAYVRGTDDYAGYCMAAAGFLSLAYTFKHGEHIRVTLIIDRLQGAAGRAMRWLAMTFGSGAAVLLAWYSVRLVVNSYEFHEVSQGVDATPLWIPQLAMAAGAVLLAVAMLDDLVCMSLGRPVVHLKKHSAEPIRVE